MNVRVLQIKPVVYLDDFKLKKKENYKGNYQGNYPTTHNVITDTPYSAAQRSFEKGEVRFCFVFGVYERTRTANSHGLGVGITKEQYAPIMNLLSTNIGQNDPSPLVNDAATINILMVNDNLDY
ncbi:hypothetical protein HAX54_003011 [Datura stramonium]|uniref:Uncharacterized protein n=1 Tax=Datura stramonium TaxID=4076 RepID=A0ABS8T5Z9_DATST|nr:hypothetical protein [Datura stramonium]